MSAVTMSPGAIDLLRRIQSGQTQFTKSLVEGSSKEFAALRQAGLISEQSGKGVQMIVSLVDAVRAGEILGAQAG